MLKAETLGQLLLMQSMVISLPDEKSMFSFVCRGLLDIPGVTDVGYAATATEQADASTVRMPLLVGETCRGELLFAVADTEAFALYRDYLQNFCFMLAVILEERSQRRQNELQQSLLEARVLERTSQLQDQVEERHLIEEALRKSKEHYRILIENAPDAILVYDVQLDRFIDANANAEKMFGCSHEKLLSCGPHDLYTTNQPDGAPVTESFSEHNEKVVNGQSLMFERAVHTFDNRDLICEVRLTNLPSEGRKLIRASFIDVTARKRMEQQLELSAQVVRNIQVGLHIYKLEDLQDDRTLRMVFANRASAEFTGVPVAEVIGKTLDENFPGLREKGIPQQYADVARTQHPFVNDDIYYGDDRVLEAAFSVKAFPLPDNQVGVSFENITERKRTEEQIRLSLREKETLLREVYHRTKNNMQVIISLLNLQSATLADPVVRQLFHDTRNRIHAMSLVHEKLYQSEDLSRVDLGSYMRDLAQSLLASYRTDQGKVSLRLELEDCDASIDFVTPLGLTINELMSNSLKHAFPGNRQGEIGITLRREGDEGMTVRYQDNGIGLPEGFDLHRAKSLGLQLISSLVESQLHGGLKIVSGKGRGAEFVMSFKDMPLVWGQR